MAPVAAEQMKYGKTVISDPRRGKRLLDVLNKIQASNSNSKNGNSGSKSNASSSGSGSGSGEGMEQENGEGLVVYPLPSEQEDRTALLEWAYFEAEALVRQYGDLLEEVEGFMETGASTVGECSLMIEDELS
jgi:hypothetical protein